MRPQTSISILTFLITACGSGLDLPSRLHSTRASIDSDSQPFRADSISGLGFWLKADHFLGALADNSTIAQSWIAESGSSVSLSTVGSPIFRTSAAPQGRPAIQFSGGSYFYSSASGLGSGLSGITIFIIGMRTAATAGDFLGLSQSSLFTGYANDYFRIGGAASISEFTVGSLDLAAAYSTSAGAVLTTSTYHLHEAVWSSSLPSSQLEYRIGDLGVWNATTSGALTSMNLSGDIKIGTASSDLVGEIAEVLVYLRALTQTERSSVRHYLSTRYGLPE